MKGDVPWPTSPYSLRPLLARSFLRPTSATRRVGAGLVSVATADYILGMKLCARCKKRLPTSAFNRNKSTKDGLTYSCAACNRERNRESYRRTKPAHLARTKRWSDVRREENRLFLWEHKLRNPCVDCGETDPRVLQFDHVRGKKGADISYLAFSAKASQDALAREIKKCDVRCANCHLKRTWDRAGYKGLIQFRPTGRGKLTTTEIAEICRAYKAKEVGMPTLARRYDVSVGTIWNTIQRNGGRCGKQDGIQGNCAGKGRSSR